VGRNAVARYYDASTWRFLLAGPGRDARTIHRELWGPGVTSRAESVEYVHGLIAHEIERASVGEEFRLLDLGCGVGGTVFGLAERWPRARMHGVTISGRQVERARRLAESLGVGERCTFARADFEHDDVGRGYDVAVAIESFVHSGAPERFFETAARALRPGGLLVLVDDFLTGPEGDLEVRPRRLVREFREGWRVPSVCTPEDCEAAAASAGFTAAGTLDLSPLVRLRRVRDRMIALLVPAFRVMDLVEIPFFGNMIGGNALRVGLERGFLSYRLHAWTR
jgi:SAM-dependent methyltransferase